MHTTGSFYVHKSTRLNFTVEVAEASHCICFGDSHYTLTSILCYFNRSQINGHGGGGGERSSSVLYSAKVFVHAVHCARTSQPLSAYKHFNKQMYLFLFPLSFSSKKSM